MGKQVPIPPRPRPNVTTGKESRFDTVLAIIPWFLITVFMVILSLFMLGFFTL